MGHIDVHLLPSTPPWRRVLGLLGTVAPDPAEVAFATASAATDRLARVRGDPGLVYCVWLLVRLASAARRPGFAESIARLGLDPRRATGVVGFLAQIGARVRDELERQPGSGPFGELAAQALTHTLAEIVGAQGTPLFASTLDDVERAFRAVGTPTQVGKLVTRFFGEFVARVLRYYVDRALPLQIGPAAGFASIQQSEVFVADLTAYARAVGSAVQTFAAEWYDLHHWQADGAIGREETAGFVAHAMEKLTAVLLREEAVA